MLEEDQARHKPRAGECVSNDRGEVLMRYLAIITVVATVIPSAEGGDSDQMGEE